MRGEPIVRLTDVMEARADPSGRRRPVAVLCGGVGAARFLTGAVQVVEPSSITAVVNTADDAVINGLAISPDLDTVVYTLAGAIDPRARVGPRRRDVEGDGRPRALRAESGRTSSDAAITWFRLGDRDLATHLYRTARRAEGATLTSITAEITAAWDVGVVVLPMTDGDVSTHLVLADGSELAFQDYFVRLHHDVEVSAVRIDTHGSRPTAAVMSAIDDAETVVIAPSNPLVSIQPLRALPGIDDGAGAAP